VEQGACLQTFLIDYSVLDVMPDASFIRVM
jgi:hypothetical protein